MNVPLWQIFDAEGARKYVDPKEFRRFIEATMKLPLRERAFCQLVAFTGCRISEALGVCGIHIGNNELVLRTLKRRKPVFRLLQIPASLAEQLHILAAQHGDAGTPFFATSRSSGYRWIKRSMQYSDINGRHACPKGLRHGFGVRSAMRSVPPSLIQKCMGHSRSDTTMIYMEIFGADARNIIARTWE